ncbi:MAG: DUF1549 and DUF1553 domain-containing protein [Planctomycetota bacterium]|nr:DUF1549 and DUF1553 domain-containing protein [Planctomycetota bacterium]
MSTQVHSSKSLPRVLRLLPTAFAALVLVGLVASLAGIGNAEETTPTTSEGWQGVTARLDAVIEARLAEEGVKPAARSSDSEFLRRLYLDLLGTVPTPDEVATFTADASEDKRAAKIEELLKSDSYDEHQASFWFRTLTGLSVHQRRQREGQGGRYVTGEGGKRFHEWLSTQVAANRPYNEMVQDLISASGRTDENGATGYIARWESNANNTAGAVARHFLGVQIQCAQCHDHIYEPDWKQSDFRGMAAFFATTRVQRVPEYNQLRRLRDASNKKKAAAKQAASKGRELKRPGADAMGEGMDGGMEGGGMDAGGMDAGGMEGKDAPATQKGKQRGRKGGTDYSKMSAAELAQAMQELRKYANLVTVSEQRVNPRQAKRFMERLKKNKNPQVAERAQLMAQTPKFWMGAEAADVAGISRRYLLGRWVTSDENPYFARTLANRMWGHFMGRGIVDPIDDFNSFQPPSHPEILEILGADFKAHGYDLRRVHRILLNSETYQRSSRWEGEEEPDALLFAKAPVRPLNTEQLYFAMTRATGLETNLNRVSRRQQQAIQQAIFSVFTFVFDDDEGKAEEDFSGSIPQGLFLMNGELLQRALSGGREMPAAKQAKFRGRKNRRFRQKPPQSMLEGLLRNETSDAARVRHLYLRAYGRAPSTDERKGAVAFVKAQGGGAKAYEDFFWALLNSAEFMTNH